MAVSVDSLTPGAPTEGDTVTVSGTVTNKGKKAVTDASVGLRVGSLLDTRSSIDRVAKNSGDVDSPVGAEIDDKYTEKFSKLTPASRSPTRSPCRPTSWTWARTASTTCPSP